MASKFDSILRSAHGEPDTQPETEKKKPRKAKPKAQTKKAPASARVIIKTTSAQRGRPRAKHSHPDFTQVTAYIRKSTHKAVKIALLEQEPPLEFSELAEQLLAGWLKSRKK